MGDGIPPGVTGNPVVAAATEAILSRRLAIQHGDGSGAGRRAAILLGALPDAAAAVEAVTPLIVADVLARVEQAAANGAAEAIGEAVRAERERIVAIARAMGATYPGFHADQTGVRTTFPFADYLEDVPVEKQGGA